MSKTALHLVAFLTLAFANPESPLEEAANTILEAHQPTDTEANCNLAHDGTCLQVIEAAGGEKRATSLSMIDSSRECSDHHHSCPLWAEQGECDENQSFMFETCALSCRACLSVTRLYGVRQVVHDSSEVFLAQTMHHYMTDQVPGNATLAKVKKACRNRDAECLHWSAQGECSANPSYMTLQCAPACRTCHMLDFEYRCPRDPDAPKVWNQPGELDSFFLRIVDTAARQSFQPTILSAPADYLSGLWDNPKVNVPDGVITDGPWVMTMENFLSEAECQRMIELGHKKGYRRSKDVGPAKFDGSYGSSQSSRRTSTNAWCSGDCFADPVVQTVSARLETFLGIPTNNSEYWQILQYKEGQQYMEHHDYIEYQRDRNVGVRILTVFFYLNDVERGGGTQFPSLNNLTVTPTTGRVLIWPSVLDLTPNEKDVRTKHRALPVEAGIKYGSNAWIHQSDFRTPHNNGCS